MVRVKSLHRAAEFAVLFIVSLIMTDAPSIADPATAAHKTPAQCNQEYYGRLAEIQAANELPSRFIHDCWHTTAQGQETLIVHQEGTSPNPTVLHPASRMSPTTSFISTERTPTKNRPVFEARQHKGHTRYRLARLPHRPRLRLATAVHWRLAQLHFASAHRSRAETLPPLRAVTGEQSLIDVAPSLVYSAAALAPPTRRGYQWARLLMYGATRKTPSEVAGAFVDLTMGSSGSSDRATRRWVQEVVCDEPVDPSAELVTPFCAHHPNL